MRNMPDKELDGKFLLVANRLDELCHKHKMISEEDLKKIREHQEEAYDKAVVLLKEYYIRRLNTKFQSNTSAEFKKEKISREKDLMKTELCLNESAPDYYSKKCKSIRNEVDLCEEGKKHFNLIKGSEYLKVTNGFNKFKQGEDIEDTKLREYANLPSSRLIAIQAKLEYLKYLNNPVDKTNKKGLASNLSVSLLKKICQKARDKGLIKCRECDFVSAFTPEKLIDFEEITWLPVSERGANKGEANKLALREFINGCIGGVEAYNKEKGCLLVKGIPKNVGHLFVDKNSKGISLSSPKKDNHSSYRHVIEEIFNEVQNLKNSE